MTTALAFAAQSFHRTTKPANLGPAPKGMCWYHSAATGQWHLEVEREARPAQSPMARWHETFADRVANARPPTI